MTPLQMTLERNEDGTGSISVLIDGENHVAISDHASYDLIVQGALAGDGSIVDLFKPADMIEEKFRPLTDRISVRNSRVYFDNDEQDNSLTQQLVRYLQEGDDETESTETDWLGLVAFYDKIQTNPDQHSRTHLYEWLQNYGEFTITLGGDLICYKGVNDDLSSVQSGQAIVNGEPVEGNIPYLPGSLIEMPRSEVRHSPSQACATGLHVATPNFANGWGSKQISVLVNPRDVVSVPTADHSAEKMRVCRFKVIEEITKPYETVLRTVEPTKAKAPKGTKAKAGKGKKKQQSPLETHDVRRFILAKTRRDLKPSILAAEINARFGIDTTKDSIRRFRNRHGV